MHNMKAKDIYRVKRWLMFAAVLSSLVLAGCLRSDTSAQQDTGISSPPSGDAAIGNAGSFGSSEDASGQSPITPSPSAPAMPEHTHSFSAATCTSPKICSCGAVDGEANGHSFSSATCLYPKTCTVCGMTDGTVSEHSYNSATCVLPKTCTVCGVTDGTPAGHEWTDATYTAPKSCTVCGAAEGDPLDVPGRSNYHGHVYTGGSSSKKYHYEAKCPGKNSHEITWDEVNTRGLEPCGTCVLK